MGYKATITEYKIHKTKISIFTRRVNGNRTENLTRRKLPQQTHGIFTAIAVIYHDL